MKVVFGDPAGDRIEFDVFGRAYLDATDFWDANWLTCTIEVFSGGQRGNAEGATVTTFELESLLIDLDSLTRRVKENVDFEPTEPYLLFNSVRTEKGFKIKGAFDPQKLTGTTFPFDFQTSESQLSASMAQLAKVVSDFPVKEHEDLEHAKALVANALEIDALNHDAGRYELIADRETQLWELQQQFDFDGLGTARNLNEAWVDERNHRFVDFYNLEKEEWPRLARHLATSIRTGQSISDPKLLVFTPSEMAEATRQSQADLRRLAFVFGFVALLFAVFILRTCLH